jgi:hypothetical protein
LPYISTLEAEGPALSLLGSIKGSTAERMAKSMAALMVIQMDKIGLKMPDIIAVFPGQHDDFNVHLANSLGELLSVKVIEPIKAPSFLCPRYRWKGFYPLSNQRVFFIGLEKPKETECNMIDEAAPKEWIFFSVL